MIDDKYIGRLFMYALMTYLAIRFSIESNDVVIYVATALMLFIVFIDILKGN